MKVKISVIVPIYNVEEYLPQCIDSIINQTCKDFELILVDDGSTDSCGKICDEYVEMDNRLRCIHKCNGGSTSARKAGIDVALGDYILFVDSDDWIWHDEIETLIDILVRNDYPDMVVFGLVEEYGADSVVRKNAVGKGLYIGEKLSEVKQKVVMDDIFFEWRFLPSLCNKLIKRSLLNQCICNVPDTISYGEDAVCSFLCILEASSIYVCEYAPYHYRQREGSIVKERCELPKRLFQEVFDVLRKAFGGMKQNLCDLKLYMFFILLLKGYSYLSSGRLPLFPFEGIEKGSRIAVYCAGGFGQVMYRHICTSADYMAAGWTDTMARKYQSQGFEVQTVEEVLHSEFDYIVIAILNESKARQIADSLFEKGVPIQKVKYIKKEVLQGMELPNWLTG